MSKSTITVITVLVIGAIIFLYFSGGTLPTSFVLLKPELPVTSEVGAKALSILNQVRYLKIDSSFFQSTAYQSLRDYSVDVPERQVDRPNPFAPIPGVVGPYGAVPQR